MVGAVGMGEGLAVSAEASVAAEPEVVAGGLGNREPAVLVFQFDQSFRACRWGRVNHDGVGVGKFHDSVRDRQVIIVVRKSVAGLWYHRQGGARVSGSWPAALHDVYPTIRVESRFEGEPHTVRFPNDRIAGHTKNCSYLGP